MKREERRETRGEKRNGRREEKREKRGETGEEKKGEREKRRETGGAVRLRRENKKCTTGPLYNIARGSPSHRYGPSVALVVGPCYRVPRRHWVLREVLLVTQERQLVFASRGTSVVSALGRWIFNWDVVVAQNNVHVSGTFPGKFPQKFDICMRAPMRPLRTVYIELEPSGPRTRAHSQSAQK